MCKQTIWIFQCLTEFDIKVIQIHSNQTNAYRVNYCFAPMLYYQKKEKNLFRTRWPKDRPMWSIAQCISIPHKNHLPIIIQHNVPQEKARHIRPIMVLVAHTQTCRQHALLVPFLLRVRVWLSLSFPYFKEICVKFQWACFCFRAMMWKQQWWIFLLLPLFFFFFFFVLDLEKSSLQSVLTRTPEMGSNSSCAIANFYSFYVS